MLERREHMQNSGIRHGGFISLLEDGHALPHREAAESLSDGDALANFDRARVDDRAFVATLGEFEA
jgi:hypothetical protein